MMRSNRRTAPDPESVVQEEYRTSASLEPRRLTVAHTRRGGGYILASSSPFSCANFGSAGGGGVEGGAGARGGENGGEEGGLLGGFSWR